MESSSVRTALQARPVGQHNRPNSPAASLSVRQTMSSAQVGAVLKHIRKLAALRTDRESPDQELLVRFAVHRDELAFEALLRRHGPMVLGVCRSILRDVHDAEDAFQAAFLILAQKA